MVVERRITTLNFNAHFLLISIRGGSCFTQSRVVLLVAAKSTANLCIYILSLYTSHTKLDGLGRIGFPSAVTYAWLRPPSTSMSWPTT